MNDGNSFTDRLFDCVRLSFALRRTTKRDDRQLRMPEEMLDLNVETIPGPSRNEDLGFGTGGSSRPVRPWLNSRSTMGRETTEVDFVGGFAAKCCVRAMLVGPADQPVHFPDHDSMPGGDNDPSQPVFDGPNRSLQNGNAAVLPDRLESRSNGVRTTPALVSRRRPELVYWSSEFSVAVLGSF